MHLAKVNNWLREKAHVGQLILRGYYIYTKTVFSPCLTYTHHLSLNFHMIMLLLADTNKHSDELKTIVSFGPLCGQVSRQRTRRRSSYKTIFTR